MRIVIAAGHFMPEVGYQEVYLARALARLGHTVRVVTTDRESPSSQPALARDRYEPGRTTDDEYGFSVVRLPAAFHLGAMVLSRHLAEEVQAFGPDVVVAMGPGKLFAAPLFGTHSGYRLVVVFGDNSDFRSVVSAGLTARTVAMSLSQVMLKDRVYRRAVRHADRVLLTTAETEAVLRRRLPADLQQALRDKQMVVPLGFDPDEFFFSPDERADERRRLEFSDDEVVFVTCTRVKREKTLERIIDEVSRLRVAGSPVRYVLAGFLDDDYSRELRAYIEAQPNPRIFTCRPFVGHSEARRLYSGADIGIWLRAAISIQEAMGTGLPVLLEDKPSVSLLVEEDVNGWRFAAGSLGAAMEAAVAAARGRARDQIARTNYERLSYDVIAERIVTAPLS